MIRICFSFALLATAPVVWAAAVKPLDDPAKREHWAFKSPVRPAVPDAASISSTAEASSKPGSLRCTEIDRFVQARLAKEGLTLTPAPEAEPATLCRRLHIDLLGLPPSPEEVDAFVRAYGAEPEKAYGTLVDRLLASPHFGERWGRHWLDAARYADSDGFEKDKPRIAHFYRDWVIGAFNRDLPYDQFLIEQLAGDQLPDATQDQKVATGFLRNSLLNEEGGVDPEQFRTEAMFDRMEAIGKAVLGLTIQCTQCHDHKFDPISQREYYQLFAFLNSDHEAQPLVYTAAEHMQRAEILRRTAELEGDLKHRTPDWEQRMHEWEDRATTSPEPNWSVVTPEWEHNSTGGQRYLPQSDGWYIAAGYQPTKHTPHGTARTEVKKIAAVRIECLCDPNLPGRGPGRSLVGTFGLTEFNMEAAPVKDGAKMSGVKFARAISDINPAPETPVHPLFNEKKPVRRVIGPAEYAIDGKDDTAWSNETGPGRRNRPCDLVLLPDKTLTSDGAGFDLVIKPQQNHGGWNSDDLMGNNLGRFRISVAEECANPDFYQIPQPVRAVFKTPRAQRSPAQQAIVFGYWRTQVPEWKEINAQIDTLWQSHPNGATQMVLEARTDPRATTLFKRGDWLKPGDPVLAGVPAVLNPLPKDALPTRLTFARWITDRKAPTTARAFVNRTWQALFGAGLLESGEDFGTQSPPPSHPELLDWLACEFMDRGWSVKSLLRLIVASHTYRQSSAVSPALLERDPYNRLLARGARFRVEGEIVRDVQLAASGLLNLQMGGRSLMPPAPLYLFQPPASYAPFPWKEETGADRYRRAVYTWRRRTTPYPMLAIFDTPDGATSCIRRMRSNTPLQALTGLNEQISLDAARALARRMIAAGKDDATRLTAGFRLVCSRVPGEADLTPLRKFLESTRRRLERGEIHPFELATGSRTDPPHGLPDDVRPRDLTALTAAARVILNLDEAVTRE